MASLQELPQIPLRRILDFMDRKSRRNLLDATELTIMGMTMKNMARKRRYICPKCVIFKGGRNMEVIYNNSDHLSITQARKISNAFDFFFGFLLSRSGNKNYRHIEVETDENGSTMSILQPQNFYSESINYTWEKTVSGRKNWMDVINDIREKKDVFNNEMDRIRRTFLGGTFDGITVEPELNVYTRREFESHICNDHNLDDELNLQEFWIFVENYANREKPVRIPRWFYTGGNIDIFALEIEVLKIVIARYYKHAKTSNSATAQALGTEEEYILEEIRKIFYFACKAFEKIYFPEQNTSHSEMSLYKYFEMNFRTIDALIN